jgi:hypothetical protein
VDTEPARISFLNLKKNIEMNKSTKLTPLQIMAFVASNSAEEHFEDDARLFAEIFPESPILKEIKDAPKWRHGALDQRMVLEILGAVDTETLIKNRRGSAEGKTKKTAKKPAGKNKTDKPGAKPVVKKEQKPAEDPAPDKKKEAPGKNTLE